MRHSRLKTYVGSSMNASRLSSALRALPRQTPSLRAARRSYADAADGKLQLSLVLPHQVCACLSPNLSAGFVLLASYGDDRSKLITMHVLSPSIQLAVSSRSTSPLRQVRWVSSPTTSRPSRPSDLGSWRLLRKLEVRGRSGLVSGDT